MLFSSFAFLFAFLPAVVLLAGLACFASYPLYLAVLIVASAAFYAWFVPEYLALLAASAAFNYAVAALIGKHQRPWLYAIGIAVNLAGLGYFKYRDFILANVDHLFGRPFMAANIVLPLAISFITFEQIAFLSDVYSGRVERGSPLRYLAFITFFPKLIAGPIIRYTEMVPQFRAIRQISLASFVTGFCIFSIGLFKKVGIADQLSPAIDRVYDAASSGLVPGADAALATIAYGARIYFDFSGYSDMAIGLGWMLGLMLPVNFFSPYKAASIIDFWRRWHITLSRFLKDYLYIPLGGSRGGTQRTYINLMIVMTLGGLWHGAGWTFVCWGALHGAALVANHFWNRVRPAFLPRLLTGVIGRILTLLIVLLGWIFFRASDLAAATNIIASLGHIDGIVSIAPEMLTLVAASWALIMIGPNTAQLFRYGFLFTQDERAYVGSIPLVSYPMVVVAGVASCAAIIIMLSGTPNAFIYFQF